MDRLIIIHRDKNVSFCMTDNPKKPEYKVLVGKETYYSHWDFDVAVKEYGIIRKNQR